MKERCETCKYFNKNLTPLDPDDDEGSCRRFPPSWHPYTEPLAGEIDCWGLFPDVGADSWCGEYKEKISSEAKDKTSRGSGEGCDDEA